VTYLSHQTEVRDEFAPKPVGPKCSITSNYSVVYTEALRKF